MLRVTIYIIIFVIWECGLLVLPSSSFAAGGPYPIIMIHGHMGKPEALNNLINKIKEDRTVRTVYAGDSDELETGAYSRNSVWNFGYYKEHASDPGDYDYIGKVVQGNFLNLDPIESGVPFKNSGEKYFIESNII